MQSHASLVPSLINLVHFCRNKTQRALVSPISYDTPSLAVDIEHELFKTSKSSNLYKAAVLKRVTADCAACHAGKMCIPELMSCFKGVRDEENSPQRGERRRWRDTEQQ